LSFIPAEHSIVLIRVHVRKAEKLEQNQKSNSEVPSINLLQHPKKRGEMKKKTILLAILLSTCLFSILALFVVLYQKTVWDKKYQTFIMGSKLMEPTLKLGDILIVDKNVNLAKLKAASKDAAIPGDIIAYYNPRHGKDVNHIVVDRAVEKYQLENGTWYFFTRGDASISLGYDPWSPIRQDFIVGKVVDVNPPLTASWNFWFWLAAASAIGTGVPSLTLLVLAYTEKTSKDM
jgi:signal peptidase I